MSIKDNNNTLPADGGSALGILDSAIGTLGAGSEETAAQLAAIRDAIAASSDAARVFDDIVRSLTRDGAPLADQLGKLVACFAQYRAIVDGSSAVATGFRSALSDLSKPADVISSGMARLAASVKDANDAMSGAGMSIDTGQAVKGMDAAILKARELAGELKKLQDMSTKPIHVNIKEHRSQETGHGGASGGIRTVSETGDTRTVEMPTRRKGRKFAKGGTVNYTSENTRRASTGGQFVGKRHGDKEIAFVNAGEAILTESAVKTGAKAAGMSVSSYVGSLNRGDLRRIKKGRSFAKGGWAPGTNSQRAAVDKIRSDYGVDVTELRLPDDIREVMEKINQGLKDDKLDKTVKNILQFLKDKVMESGRSPLKGGTLQGMLNLNLTEGGKGDVDWKRMIESLVGGAGSVDLGEGLNPVGLEKFKEQMAAVQKQTNRAFEAIRGFDDKVNSIGEAVGESMKNRMNKLYYEIQDVFGYGGAKLINDTNGKLGAVLKTVGSLAIAYKKVGDLADWYRQQADISIGFDKAAAAASTWGSVATASFKNAVDMFHLTRKEAAEFGAVMADVSKGGMNSGEVVMQMAANMRSAFGEVDISALKEAAAIIKDLPADQVQSLFQGGGGGFENGANLLANLMKGGSQAFEKIADAQMKGAFGEVNGMPNISEADKAIIEANKESNRILDDMDKELYRLSRGILGPLSQSAKATMKMFGRTVLITGTLGMMLGWLSKINLRMNTSVPVHNVNPITAMRNGATGGGPMQDARNLLSGSEGRRTFMRQHSTLTHGINRMRHLGRTPVTWGSTIPGAGAGKTLTTVGNLAGTSLAAGAIVYSAGAIAEKIAKSSADKIERRQFEKDKALGVSSNSSYSSMAKRAEASAMKESTKKAKWFGTAVALTAGAIMTLIPGLNAFGIALTAATIAGLAAGAGAGYKKYRDTSSFLGNREIRNKGNFSGGLAYELHTSDEERERDFKKIREMPVSFGTQFINGLDTFVRGGIPAIFTGGKSWTNAKQRAADRIYNENASKYYLDKNAQHEMSIYQAYDRLNGERIADQIRNRFGYDTEVRFNKKTDKSGALQNDYSQVLIRTAHQVEKGSDGMWSSVEGFLKFARYNMIDITRRVKRIEAIEKGLYTARFKENADTNAKNIQAMQTAGGTNASFRMNVGMGMSDTMHEWRTRMNMLDVEKKNVIHSNGSREEMAVQLNRIMAAELSAHKALVEGLNQFVGQVSKMPELMVRTIKENLKRELTDFQNAGFGTTLSGAVAGSGASFENAIKSMSDVSSYGSFSTARINEIEGLMKGVQKERDEIIKWIKGIDLKMGGTGEFNAGTVEKYAALNDKFEKTLVSSGVVSADDYSFMQDLIKRAGELQSEKAGEERRGENANGFIELGEQFKIVIDKRLKEMGDSLSDDEKKVLQGMKTNAERVLTEFDRLNKIGQMSEGVTPENLIANLLNNMNTYAQNGGFGNTGKIVKLKEKFASENGGANVDEIQRLLSLARSVTGAENMNLAYENSKATELRSLADQFKQQSAVFEKNLADVFHNGSVEFSKALSDVLAKRESYRGLASGEEGSQVVAKSLDASIAEAQARIESLGASRELQDRLIKMVGDTAGEIDTARKGGTLNENQAAYLTKMVERQQAVYKAMLNPEDTAAQQAVVRAESDLKAAEAKLTAGDREGGDFKKFMAELSTAGAAIKGTMNDITEVFEKTMKAWEDIPKIVERSLGVDRQLRVDTSRVESQSAATDYLNKYGDYADAVGSGIRQMQMASDAYRRSMQVIGKSYSEGVSKAEKMYRTQVEEAMRLTDPAARQKKLEEALASKEIALANLQKENAKSMAARSDELKKQIDEAFAPRTEKAARVGQALEVQKDVANSIGMPFEFVLKVEQNIVQLAREEAKIEEEKLAVMEKNNERGKVYEEQKLKVAQAQAKVLKAAFGAQRGSLEKMLGKIMGTFTEVGGIFGPDGARMLAKKYGQGYSTTEGGLAVAAGPNAHNGYEHRRYANSGVANGFGNAAGAGDYGFNWSSGNSMGGAVTNAHAVMGGFMQGHDEGFVSAAGNGDVSQAKSMSIADVIKKYGRDFIDRLGRRKRRSITDDKEVLLGYGEDVISRRGGNKSASGLGVSRHALAAAFNSGRLRDFLSRYSPVFAAVDGYVGGTPDEPAAGIEPAAKAVDPGRNADATAKNVAMIADVISKGGGNGIPVVDISGKRSFDDLKAEVRDLHGSLAEKRAAAFKKAGFEKFAGLTDNQLRKQLGVLKTQWTKQMSAGQREQAAATEKNMRLIQRALMISGKLRFIEGDKTSPEVMGGGAVPGYPQQGPASGGQAQGGAPAQGGVGAGGSGAGKSDDLARQFEDEQREQMIEEQLQEEGVERERESERRAAEMDAEDSERMTDEMLEEERREREERRENRRIYARAVKNGTTYGMEKRKSREEQEKGLREQIIARRIKESDSEIGRRVSGEAEARAIDLFGEETEENKAERDEFKRGVIEAEGQSQMEEARRRIRAEEEKASAERIEREMAAGGGEAQAWDDYSEWYEKKHGKKARKAKTQEELDKEKRTAEKRAEFISGGLAGGFVEGVNEFISGSLPDDLVYGDMAPPSEYDRMMAALEGAGGQEGGVPAAAAPAGTPVPGKKKVSFDRAAYERNVGRENTISRNKARMDDLDVMKRSYRESAEGYAKLFGLDSSKIDYKTASGLATKYAGTPMYEAAAMFAETAFNLEESARESEELSQENARLESEKEEAGGRGYDFGQGVGYAGLKLNGKFTPAAYERRVLEEDLSKNYGVKDENMAGVMDALRMYRNGTLDKGDSNYEFVKKFDTEHRAKEIDRHSQELADMKSSAEQTRKTREADEARLREITGIDYDTAVGYRAAGTFKFNKEAQSLMERISLAKAQEREAEKSQTAGYNADRIARLKREQEEIDRAQEQYSNVAREAPADAGVPDVTASSPETEEPGPNDVEPPEPEPFREPETSAHEGEPEYAGPSGKPAYDEEAHRRNVERRRKIDENKQAMRAVKEKRRGVQRRVDAFKERYWSMFLDDNGRPRMGKDGKPIDVRTVAEEALRKDGFASTKRLLEALDEDEGYKAEMERLGSENAGLEQEIAADSAGGNGYEMGAEERERLVKGLLAEQGLADNEENRAKVGEQVRNLEMYRNGTLDKGSAEYKMQHEAHVKLNRGAIAANNEEIARLQKELERAEKSAAQGNGTLRGRQMNVEAGALREMIDDLNEQNAELEAEITEKPVAQAEEPAGGQPAPASGAAGEEDPIALLMAGAAEWDRKLAAEKANAEAGKPAAKPEAAKPNPALDAQFADIERSIAEQTGSDTGELTAEQIERQQREVLEALGVLDVSYKMQEQADLQAMDAAAEGAAAAQEQAAQVMDDAAAAYEEIQKAEEEAAENSQMADFDNAVAAAQEAAENAARLEPATGADEAAMAADFAAAAGYEEMEETAPLVEFDNTVAAGQEAAGRQEPAAGMDEAEAAGLEASAQAARETDRMMEEMRESRSKYDKWITTSWLPELIPGQRMEDETEQWFQGGVALGGYDDTYNGRKEYFADMMDAMIGDADITDEERAAVRQENLDYFDNAVKEHEREIEKSRVRNEMGLYRDWITNPSEDETMVGDMTGVHKIEDWFQGGVAMGTYEDTEEGRQQFFMDSIESALEHSDLGEEDREALRNEGLEYYLEAMNESVGGLEGVMDDMEPESAHGGEPEPEPAQAEWPDDLGESRSQEGEPGFQEPAPPPEPVAEQEPAQTDFVTDIADEQAEQMIQEMEQEAVAEELNEPPGAEAKREYREKGTSSGQRGTANMMMSEEAESLAVQKGVYDLIARGVELLEKLDVVEITNAVKELVTVLGNLPSVKEEAATEEAEAQEGPPAAEEKNSETGGAAAGAGLGAGTVDVGGAAAVPGAQVPAVPENAQKREVTDDTIAADQMNEELRSQGYNIPPLPGSLPPVAPPEEPAAPPVPEASVNSLAWTAPSLFVDTVANGLPAPAPAGGQGNAPIGTLTSDVSGSNGSYTLNVRIQLDKDSLPGLVLEGDVDKKIVAALANGSTPAGISLPRA